jgi:hypothetical protein
MKLLSVGGTCVNSDLDAVPGDVWESWLEGFEEGRLISFCLTC